MNKPKRIMLIDDEPINNFISGKIIEKFSDYRVESFTRAQDALDQLKSAPLPEFIFLDINMPEMDGWDFLEEYSKLPPGVTAYCPVVMLTSSIDTKDIEKSRSFGCVCSFISKPLTPEDLKDVIHTRQTKYLRYG